MEIGNVKKWLGKALAAALVPVLAAALVLGPKKGAAAAAAGNSVTAGNAAAAGDAAAADDSAAAGDAVTEGNTAAQTQGIGEPGALNSGTNLVIDNQNRYDGMDRTYSEGYIPRVQKGSVTLIVPLLCSSGLQDNCLRASLSLGEGENVPFVIKNYEKTIPLTRNPVNDGSQTVESYVVAFSLELKAKRYNGSYPVTVNIQAKDGLGGEVRQTFTVYVTITDGEELKDEADANKLFSPKVVVDSCQFSKEGIQAGDEVTAEITLKNTSKTEGIRDLTVKVKAESEYLTLLQQSDTVYAASIPAGGKTTVTCRFQVNIAAPQGQYALGLAMAYADSKANTCSEEGQVMLSVTQPLQLKFDPLVFPAEVEVGDGVEATIQVMNLGRGKVYNVRVVLAADGLSPQGTIFIGDLEPGTMASGSAQVDVGGLTEGSTPYGVTEGEVTCFYQDEAGAEHSEIMAFETRIKSPFSKEAVKPEDNTGQWWIIMAVIGGVLAAFGVVALVRKIRRRKQEEQEEREEHGERDEEVLDVPKTG